MKPSVPFFIFFPFSFFIFLFLILIFLWTIKGRSSGEYFILSFYPKIFFAYFHLTRQEEKRGAIKAAKKKYIGRGPRERIRPRSFVSSANNNNNKKTNCVSNIFEKKGSVLMWTGLLFTVYTYTSVYPCLVLISSSSVEGTIDGKWQANNRCRQLYSCICTVGLVWKRNQIPKVSYRPSVYFVKLYIHFISFIHYRFLFYSPHFPLFLTIFGLAPPL